MKLVIRPSKLAGKVTAPPSKSYAHRALIAAALADGQSHIANVAACDDVLATIDVLRAFGCSINWQQNSLTVVPAPFKTPQGRLNCRASASTLRFMLPLALLVDGACTFDGYPSLAERPLDDYLTLFKRHNINLKYDGKLPLTLSGRPLSGQLDIAANISSQYISGLLFALPLAAQPSVIRLTTALQSAAYVALTIDVLQHFGIAITASANGWQVAGGQRYRATDYRVAGDYSNAAYWLVAATLGGAIEVDDLAPDSLQGDRAIVDLINQMGGAVQPTEGGYFAESAKTVGRTIDVSQIVDLVPIIALLASVSNGLTRLTGGARLRYKESDRIAAVVAQLTALGADIKATDDGMIINGKSQLNGGVVDSCGDHRIAMMLTIAATVCRQPIILQNAAAVAKSYPQFYQQFASLGGIYEQHNR